MLYYIGVRIPILGESGTITFPEQVSPTLENDVLC